MAARESSEAWRIVVILAALLATSATAGEKVRFGPLGGGNVPTRPMRVASEPIELKSSISLNQASPAGAPRPAPSSSTASNRKSRIDSEDQRNWIFQDTRSAAGVQKALGVETYEEAAPTVADRDSVTVIQDYFSSRRNQSADVIQNGTGPSGWGGAASAGSSFSLSGLSTPVGGPSNGAGGGSADKIFGDSAFRNTLNSDNLTVRRYFRDLYTSPGGSSSSMGPAAGSPGNSPARGIQNSQTRPSGLDSASQQSLNELANRAALVNSLSAKAEDPASLNPTPTLNQPARGNDDLPVVNQGKLFERRNGLIEIPGRKF